MSGKIDMAATKIERDKEVDSIKTIYSHEQIQKRVAELGAQISADYVELENPVVIGVMKGAFC
ncbi:MAG: hypothetical protein WCT03_05890, partial [Candidatus Obscuribacterales bacterium]